MPQDMSPMTSLLVKALICWVVYRLSAALYSVYFGPLSKVPGPKLAAATRLVLLYHRIKGDAETWRLKLHNRYGGVVRPAPNDVSFAIGKAWKEVYGYQQGSKFQRNQKDPKFYVVRKTTTSMIMADDTTHARQRKVFSHAFSDKALKQQEPLLRQYVGQLISNLDTRSESGQPIDIMKFYNFTTFDIMGDLAWGEPLGCLQNSSYTPWVSLIFATVKLGMFLIEMRHFPLLAFLISLMVPASLRRKRNQHFKQSADRVDKRISRQDEVQRPDIWGLVLSSKEESKLNLAEMHSHAQLFMAAGTETTATLLSGLTFYLLSNPSTMSELKREIRASFATADDIDINTLANLPYLNACIEEGLRMYPPIPTGLPRITPKGGSNICGYDLPGQTSIYVHQYSTYHNPKNFRLPDSFIPARWLVTNPSLPQYYDSSSPFSDDDRSAVQPFSVGPRNCLGINLAYLEIRLILATVVWHFDLELCEESREWDRQKVFNLWEKGPLMVRVRKAVSADQTG